MLTDEQVKEMELLAKEQEGQGWLRGNLAGKDAAVYKERARLLRAMIASLGSGASAVKEEPMTGRATILPEAVEGSARSPRDSGRVEVTTVTDVGGSILMPLGSGRGAHVLTINGVKICAGDRVTVERSDTDGLDDKPLEEVLKDLRENGLDPNPLIKFAHEKLAERRAHSDNAAVDRFAAAMKVKLAKKREQGAGGWETASAAHLSGLLTNHIAKGDPVDVGNLAMMLWCNGQRVADRTSPLDRRAADALADEVAILIKRGVLSTRSPAADALLDYRDPPMSARAERLFAERHARKCDCPPDAHGEHCVYHPDQVRGPEQREDRRFGTVVLLTREGKLYLAQRIGCPTWNGKWQVAGGGVDAGEGPRHAAQRETREETGLDIDARRFVYLGTSRERTPQGTTMLCYIFEVALRPDEVPARTEPDKHGPWELVPKDEVLRRDVMDSLKSDVVRRAYLESNRP